jgi:DnaK suppressor protein
METKVTNIEEADLRRRKDSLQATLKELQGASRERDELRVEALADPLDQIRSNTDREMTIHRLDQQAQLIRAVEVALAKIELGTYGLCEDCEEPMPRKRLDAIPWAPLCVACQSKAETMGGASRASFEDAA